MESRGFSLQEFLRELAGLVTFQTCLRPVKEGYGLFMTIAGAGATGSTCPRSDCAAKPCDQGRLRCNGYVNTASYW